MPERHEIEAFLTLAEELHFGRTAERLHVSTTRVSQTIRKLERAVGVPLFERTSRRVTLTPIGSQLRDELRPAWDQVQQSLRNAIAAGRGITGVLHVGYFGSDAALFLHAATDAFRRRYPECDVQIVELHLNNGVAALQTGQVDMELARLPADHPELAGGPVLFTEPKVLAVSSYHPFARRTSVSLEDLADVQVLQNPSAVLDSWDEFHSPKVTPSGRPIPHIPGAETFMGMLALVGAGKGVYPEGGRAMRFYVRPDITYVPFRDTPPIEWGLIWLGTRETARIRAFDQTAQLVAPDLPTPPTS
ncbi:LysR family transcriptional regulator [Spirillospora sp. CA-128828]|uniref:LysR family transcriptional regulator n=1 Tax=Spirillospora sp. CA-128828 TaxID=3240033 RepID=UPI003D8DCC38